MFLSLYFTVRRMYHWVLLQKVFEYKYLKSNLFLKSVKKIRMELAIGKSPNNIDYDFFVHY